RASESARCGPGSGPSWASGGSACGPASAAVGGRWSAPEP
ncbi:uncharacterized protein METZ01_LOCUS349603, partial [marine metagenome]